jgi:hypothetical protein
LDKLGSRVVQKPKPWRRRRCQEFDTYATTTIRLSAKLLESRIEWWMFLGFRESPPKSLPDVPELGRTDRIELFELDAKGHFDHGRFLELR